MFAPKRLLKIGSLVGVFGLLSLFPARIAYQWFAPDEVLVSGIAGTVWSGAAREVTVNGFYMHDLQWAFRPLDLLTGKLGYAIESRFSTGSVAGNIALGISGNIKASDLTATLPLDALRSVPALTGARGTLSARIDRLQTSGGLPVVADGNIEVAGLLLPLVHREPIGGFKAEFFTQDSGIVASIEDTAAVINLAGSLQLANDGAYEFLAQISPMDSTPPQLREQLRFLGSANDRGQHELRLEGRL